MNIEQITDYCLKNKGVTASFPFDNETLTFKVGTKIFLLMNLNRFPLFFNVKTDPQWSDLLREQYSQITGAYHQNKKHWNSVIIEGLPEKLIFQLIDHSYKLVFHSLPKKEKMVIENGI